MDKQLTIYLIVGLPGAGKTTRAKELEISESALRLTPDEWQIAIFGGANPPHKRDLVEGKLVQVGMRAAQLGINGSSELCMGGLVSVGAVSGGGEEYA